MWQFPVTGILVFLLWAESGSQDCIDNKCINAVEEILPTDNPDDIIKKLRKTWIRNYSIVAWRRSMIIAIVLAFIINEYYRGDGWLFFLLAFFIMVVSYSIETCNQWYNHRKINKYKLHYLDNLRFSKFDF